MKWQEEIDYLEKFYCALVALVSARHRHSVPLLVYPCRDLVEASHHLKLPALHVNAIGSIFAYVVAAVFAMYLMNIFLSMCFVKAVESVLSIKCLITFSSNIRLYLMNHECLEFPSFFSPLPHSDIYNDSAEPGLLD